MKKITISYIGGGSKNWAQKYFADLLSQDKVCGLIKLYDIDNKASIKNVKCFNKMLKNKKAINKEWECVAEPDINKALKDSDFVLISILPYSLFNMYHDVHYAEKYGVYQPVGDTVGVGGYSRALRTLRAFEFFGQKIKENCPNAWVINYTNPMSMCTNALYTAFPGIKCFGCCHEVFSSQNLICGVMDLYNSLDEEGQKAFMESDYEKVLEACKRANVKFDSYKHPHTDRHEISTNVQGVNHFTFIDKATYKGKDIYPIYEAFVPMFKKHTKRAQNIVKFDLYENFGIFGAAGDRHLSEFTPDRYLPLNKKKYHNETGFTLTTVPFRIVRDYYQRFKLFLVANGLAPTKISKTGEEGVLQIIALCGLGDLISNVNVPNQGQAPDLPMGTAVETNALFKEDAIEPLNAGVIKSKFVHDREELHASNQRDYVNAFFKKDKECLRKVFKQDPQVARLDNTIQDKLFDEMINCNKDVLEDWLTK